MFVFSLVIGEAVDLNLLEPVASQSCSAAGTDPAGTDPAGTDPDEAAPAGDSTKLLIVALLPAVMELKREFAKRARMFFHR
jgi:hypothetical protein